MISKNEYVKLLEAVANFDNATVMAAEALDIQVSESAPTRFIDAVVNMLAAETHDEGIGDLPDVEVRDCGRHLLEHDLPLIFYWCWDLNFGDGDVDGNVATVVVEGTAYKLNSAATLWDCVNHLHQLRCHYDIDSDIDSSALFDAGM